MIAGRSTNLLVVMTTVCDCREKYESLLEKESRKNQLNSIGHNHSHDSAIDADLQEWELETLHFEVVSHAMSISCQFTATILAMFSFILLAMHSPASRLRMSETEPCTA